MFIYVYTHTICICVCIYIYREREREIHNYMCIYIYIYIHTYICRGDVFRRGAREAEATPAQRAPNTCRFHIYIYIYSEREREICVYVYIHIYIYIHIHVTTGSMKRATSAPAEGPAYGEPRENNLKQRLYTFDFQRYCPNPEPNPQRKQHPKFLPKLFPLGVVLRCRSVLPKI